MHMTQLCDSNHFKICRNIIHLYIPLECVDGDVRVSNQEFLEVCINNTWARICAEFLGDKEASVACQQLGYSVGEGEAFHVHQQIQCMGIVHSDLVYCN